MFPSHDIVVLLVFQVLVELLVLAASLRIKQLYYKDILALKNNGLNLLKL